MRALALGGRPHGNERLARQHLAPGGKQAWGDVLACGGDDLARLRVHQISGQEAGRDRIVGIAPAAFQVERKVHVAVRAAVLVVHHDILGDEYLHSQAIGLWGPIGAKRHHGNECAAQVGQLTNIIYNRDGMCHTIVNITGSGLPYAIQKTIVEDLFGEGCLDAPKDYTPMNESKARFAKFGIMRQVLHDSFTLCNWVWPMTFSPRKERGYKGDLSVEAQYMSAITGQEWSEEELDHAVERCIQLHRAMTVKAAGTTDMRNNHDVISNFIFDMDPDKQPFTPGTVKLEREDWQKALTMFYQQFGWDPTTGAPTRETLEKFDLKDVADDLEALNLLP